jgi:hypothetical protein
MNKKQNMEKITRKPKEQQVLVAPMEEHKFKVFGGGGHL